MTNALKGHAMNRGTLMVLKRILVSALGALGLGALAAGTASGQTAGEGNIPAPDVFNDQITCSQLVPTPAGFNLPSTVQKGDKTSPLDDIIGNGTTTLTTGEGGISGENAAARLAGLGYVIPGGNMNCGAGTTGPTLGTMNDDANMDGDFIDAGDTLAWGSVPEDVADGYTELLDKFKAVYGDPAGTTGGTRRALAAAESALAKELAKTTPDTTEVTRLTKARDDARAANTKALGAYNAASGGPIYQAGVAEWMAKAAVTKSVADYNKQVTATNKAKTDLDGMQYSEWTVTGTGADLTVAQGRSKYVPLANTDLIGGEGANAVVTIANGMATVGQYSALQVYANHDGMTAGTAAVAAMGSTDAMSSSSANSNFTAAGALIVPMEAYAHDTDDSTPLVLRNTVSLNGDSLNSVATIRTRVVNVRLAEQALKKARDDNLNPLLQAVYDEAYRRAKLERDYYDALWNNVLADTTDHRSAEQRDQGTTETPNTDYVANPITIASRNAASISASNKRVAAETDLRSKVAAREAATAEVVKQFTGAQSFYAQLVARREALKAAADKVVADATTPSDAQTKAAANAATALTKAQADKATIDGFYDDADDPSLALVTELLKSGGDDGQKLVDAISSNYTTANEAKEKADEVAESIEGLTGEGGDVAQNTAAIATNADAIEDNADAIADNTAAISTNADAIEDNADDIATNAGNIATNATDIATNAADIMTNAGNIATNVTDIATNATDIATNVGNIATNVTDIATNAGNIATNAAGISSNADAIAANMNSIGQNASAIGRNETAIMGLQDQMEVVRAGVAASMALAGMPAINGRGISIGVGSFDGESAFAVGFQIQGEMASFKVGVTSAGGETGASAGVGFQF